MNSLPWWSILVGFFAIFLVEGFSCPPIFAALIAISIIFWPFRNCDLWAESGNDVLFAPRNEYRLRALRGDAEAILICAVLFLACVMAILTRTASSPIWLVAYLVPLPLSFFRQPEVTYGLVRSIHPFMRPFARLVTIRSRRGSRAK